MLKGPDPSERIPSEVNTTFVSTGLISIYLLTVLLYLSTPKFVPKKKTREMVDSFSLKLRQVLFPRKYNYGLTTLCLQVLNCRTNPVFHKSGQ